MPRPLPPDDVAHHLTEVFAVLGPLYRRTARLVADSEPIEGVSIGVRAVLDLVRTNGPMTVPQMGRAQAISRQYVQRMVDDARTRGWVELTPNPSHRRSSLVALTPEGKSVIAAVAARELAALREVGGELTADDVSACLRVLRAMLDLVDGVDVE